MAKELSNIVLSSLLDRVPEPLQKVTSSPFFESKISRLRAAIETRRLTKESIQFLKNSGERVNAEDKADLRTFFTGYFEGESWLRKRLTFDNPPYVLVASSNSSDTRTLYASLEENAVIFNPKSFLEELHKTFTGGLAVNTDDDFKFLDTFPNLSITQFGQASGIEESLHIAQMRRLKTRHGSFLSPVNQTISFEMAAYLRQPHEAEAIGYEWLFFHEKHVDPNPYQGLFNLVKDVLETLPSWSEVNNGAA